MGNQPAGWLIRSVVAFHVLLCSYGCSTTSTEANADLQGDPQLAAQIKDTLSQDPRVNSADITVTAEHGGVIHLSGTVASAEELSQVRRDTQAAAGVRAVVEDLQLKDYGGAG